MQESIRRKYSKVEVAKALGDSPKQDCIWMKDVVEGMHLVDPEQFVVGGTKKERVTYV